MSFYPWKSIVTLTLACSATFTIADEPASNVSPKDKLVVETVLRLKSFDIESSAPAKAAMLRYLRAQPGTDQYFELIKRFPLPEIADDLVDYSMKHADQTGGARGAELLFAMKHENALQKIIETGSPEQAAAAVKLIGHAAGSQTVVLLLPLLTDSDIPVGVRTEAASAIGKRIDGQRQLLKLVTKGELPKDLTFVAANALLSSRKPEIAEEASKHLQLPATADSQPLPPLAELIKRKGNVKPGEVIFQTIGTCNKCHKVRGEGKEVGPDLTEIGSKLSREAMYVSILDPSAAVSHNYETYAVLTDEGTTVTGLLISDTDDAVTLRTSEGIDKKVEKDAIEIFQKQKQSLMPQGLQQLLTVDQLVDLIEYLMTLQKVKS